MATTLVSLTQPVPIGDIQTDIENTINARERLQMLVLLAVQRKDAQNAFLKTFAADLAAVKGDLDKGFVDAQFAKFNAWKAADDEMAKRIDALQTIAALLTVRIDEFKAAYRNEIIALLTRQIESLTEQLQKQEFQEDILNQRIEALKGELDALKPGDAAEKPSAAAKRGKS